MRKKSTQKILAEKLRFVGTFTFVDLLGRLISDGFKEILIETNCGTEWMVIVWLWSLKYQSQMTTNGICENEGKEWAFQAL